MTEIEELIEATRDPAANKRSWATISLGKVEGRPEVVEALIRVAREDSEEHIRRFAVQSLEQVGARTDANRIRTEMLSSPDMQTRLEAIWELGKSGDPGAGDALIAMLHREGSPLHYGFLFQALADLRDPRALGAISHYLGARDPVLRAHAAQALGSLGDGRAIELLRKVEGDTAHAWTEDRGPSVTVGDLAREAIRKLGGETSHKPWWKVW